MRFNSHYELEGRHAFLSASQYHWIRYTPDRLREIVVSRKAAMLGTALHEYANDAIRLRIKQVKNGKTLNSYINDAIGFRMQTEQILFFSEHAFGTVDAIAFRDNWLRIHDLKNGITKASFDQLLVYAAFFCVEYGHDPKDLNIELRIYQNDEILVMSTANEFNPILDTVNGIIETLYEFEKILNEVGEEL